MALRGFCFFLFLVSTAVQAQNFGLELLSNWDRGDLPIYDNQSYSDIWGWHDGKGREYAIIGSLDSIYFVEVTNPEKPELRDVKAGKASLVIHRDFKTYKQYCYAVADEGNSSLQVFDLSYLPDSVQKVYDSDEWAIRTHNIFIERDRLYLATCDTKFDNLKPLRVLSLQNPETPEFLCDLEVPLVGGRPLFDVVHDVHVKDDTAYCSTGDFGMYVFKYSDSTVRVTSDSTWTEYRPNLKLVNFGVVINSSQSKYNHSSWLTPNGRHLVMAEETHGAELKVVSISHRTGHEIIAKFGEKAREGSIAHNPFILGDLVFVSYYHLGLLVFNISDPENPMKVAHYDTYPDDTNFEEYLGCWGVYPFLPSGNVIASDQIYGLFVFDHTLSVPQVNTTHIDVAVFPSITAGNVNVQISGADFEDFNLSVIDIHGRVRYSSIQKGDEGVLRLSHLPSGLYWLRVESENFAEVKSLILR